MLPSSARLASPKSFVGCCAVATTGQARNASNRNALTIRRLLFQSDLPASAGLAHGFLVCIKSPASCGRRDEPRRSPTTIFFGENRVLLYGRERLLSGVDGSGSVES